MEHQPENARNLRHVGHAPLNHGRRALMIAAAGSMFTCVAAQTQPKKLQTITLGQISLSFWTQRILDRIRPERAGSRGAVSGRTLFLGRA
ncbi:hypothetical protein [Caballeronia sp. LZ032]|nr:hypothetical protein [Caballeronia sp. LZ032]MDR5881603.1 hypothetical protein [Caballeronia sp. LZ032]